MIKKLLLSLVIAYTSLSFANLTRYGGNLGGESVGNARGAQWDAKGICYKCAGRGFVDNTDTASIASAVRCPACQGKHRQKDIVRPRFGVTFGGKIKLGKTTKLYDDIGLLVQQLPMGRNPYATKNGSH